jgi:hypothetical protein
MTDPRSVSDLAEAISVLDFVDIIVYESRGQRRDGGFTDLLDDAPEQPGTAQLRMDVRVSDSPDALAIRAQCLAASPDVVVAYDAAVIYRKTEPVALERPTSEAFVSNVGIVALYPFLREGIHEVSSRLGFPIKLGMVKREDGEAQPTAE